MEDNFSPIADEVFSTFEDLSNYFRKEDMQLSYAEIFDLAIKLKAYENSFEATSEMEITNTHLKNIINAIYES
tara:strand:+ start:327 stop:545 length:219 start_codon:yes stop_codon:yes gene_type:complete